MEEFYPEDSAEMLQKTLLDGKTLDEVAEEEEDSMQSPEVHEANTSNCYSFLVKEYHADLIATTKDYYRNSKISTEI